MPSVDDLVNRAISKANGGNIHSVLVLCSYYRSSMSISTTTLNAWPENRRSQRLRDIAKYEWALQHVTDTGKLPNFSDYHIG